MSCVRSVRHWFVAGAGLLSLTACAEFYPRFDSPLNPDIRELRSVEVVDGVKCAITGFLRDRAVKVSEKAILEARTHQCRTEGTDWSIVFLKRAKPKDKDCTKANRLEDVTPLECNPTYYAWAYETYQKTGKKHIATGTNCVPNGGCLPGTTPRGNGTCVVNDGSRFAIDPNNNAAIELTLTSNNTGGIHYTRLDAAHLGWLERFIAPGGVPAGTPFPQIEAKSKGSNVVAVKLIMPQSPYIKERSPDKTHPHIARDIEKIKEKIRLAVFEDEEKKRLKRMLPEAMRSFVDDIGAPAAREPVAYTPQALSALANEENAEFLDKCTDRKIDFVALKRLIEKFVAEKEDLMFRGSPDVFLDELVLTTSFQITLDASAGTYHIFRFFPVLVPPTLKLNPDHTNQLKITFRGVKGRGSPRNREAIRQRCLTRLQGVPGASSECNKPSTLMLESVIEAVESNKSGG